MCDNVYEWNTVVAFWYFSLYLQDFGLFSIELPYNLRPRAEPDPSNLLILCSMSD